MASPASLAFFLLFISSPLILQIHARDSHFFSKVTTTQTPTQTDVLPDKEKEQQSVVNPNQETEQQQPEFLPQNGNGYGLYGHETSLNAPESDIVTSTAQAPSSYMSEKYYDNNKDDAFTQQFGNGEGETFYSNNGEKSDTPSFNTEKEDLLNFDDAFDTSRYGNGEIFDSDSNNGVGTEHYTTESQKENNGGETYYNTDKSGSRFRSQVGQKEADIETYYKDNRFDNRFTDELNSRYKAYRGEPNAERKGMSDTRFVENGKYYYDLEKEQNKYDNRRNTYNNRGYESNEEVVGNREYDGASYDNSGADKYEFNSMEEYEKSRLNQYDP